MTIVVRRATLEDAEAAGAVHAKSARAAYAGVAADDWRGFDDDVRAGQWRTFVASGEEGFVCEVGGSVVGVASIAERADGGGELGTLYVVPSAWGTGAGPALLAAAEEALARRFGEATLNVLVSNTRARRFYERHGWTHVETRVEPHFGRDAIEIAVYRKRLSRSRSPA